MIILDLDHLFSDHQPHTPQEIGSIAAKYGLTFLQSLIFVNAESVDSPYARVAGDGCWYYISRHSPAYQNVLKELAHKYTKLSPQ
jgi:hypothetical protein